MPAITQDSVVRTLTELDFVRLQKLGGGQLPDELEENFLHADLSEGRTIPPDVVTMNSRVDITDLASGARQTLTLCYPADAQPARGRISVLSPVGAGLLGLRAGTVARWRTPQGGDCSARIDAVVFQPEASGDYVA